MANEPLAPLPFADLMHCLGEGDARAAQVVFDQYADRLVRFAAHRLPGLLRGKVDPDDVVQSVFRSFFLRHHAGQFRLDDWDSLWAVLTVITIRKCGHKVEYFQAQRRDARREKDVGAESHGPTLSDRAVALEPTPAEAVLLAETVEQVMRHLTAEQRPILQLRLQGHDTEEIATEVGCSERTVQRVLGRVRQFLEGQMA